jgi:hypothetical protein
VKTTVAIVLGVVLGVVSVSAGADISREQQEQLIKNFLMVTGRGDQGSVKALRQEMSSGEELPIKCGTPAISDFVINRPRLDKDLLQRFSADSTFDRPVLPNSYTSPSGRFMIHYTTTGADAVYQPSVQIGGVPAYVVSMGKIFDSVFSHIVITLGYPVPPNDGFYPKGGGTEFDVYLHNLQNVYGQTWMDSLSIDGPGSLRCTAFMELENDYQESVFWRYKSRPLDAVRVTAAHEYFHVVQFGIDFTEAEDYTEYLAKRYWMEMSAVWMEEENYDGINDYYLYLPFFFNRPGSSIQQFSSWVDQHPYASCVFPIMLSEVFTKDVIRQIWLGCSENPGPDFLRVAQEVIDSATNHEESFATVFSEFALWNYFTGSRDTLAPAGVGYSEKEYYPAIPDTAMHIRRVYPVSMSPMLNPLNPHHNAAFYLQLEDLSTIIYDTSYWQCDVYDTSYWHCNAGTFPNCTDSTEVTDTTTGYDFVHIACTDSTDVTADTTAGYDFVHIDSLMKMYECFDQTFMRQWGKRLVSCLEESPDDYFVDRYLVGPGGSRCDSNFYFDPHRFQSLTFIFTPASEDYRNFIETEPIKVGYYINESSVPDSTWINLPAAILKPYPNPAVLGEIPDGLVKFQFQVPTDSLSAPVYTNAALSVDIFNVAGEFITTLTRPDELRGDPTRGSYIVTWDAKNQGGKDVASGVYLAYARLYSASKKGELLAEDKAKVAVIR